MRVIIDIEDKIFKTVTSLTALQVSDVDKAEEIANLANEIRNKDIVINLDDMCELDTKEAKNMQMALVTIALFVEYNR